MKKMLKSILISSIIILPIALYSYRKIKFQTVPEKMRKLIDKIKSYEELEDVMKNHGKHPIFYISKLNKLKLKKRIFKIKHN